MFGLLLILLSSLAISDELCKIAVENGRQYLQHVSATQGGEFSQFLVVPFLNGNEGVIGFLLHINRSFLPQPGQGVKPFSQDGQGLLGRVFHSARASAIASSAFACLSPCVISLPMPSISTRVFRGAPVAPVTWNAPSLSAGIERKRIRSLSAAFHRSARVVRFALMSRSSSTPGKPRAMRWSRYFNKASWKSPCLCCDALSSSDRSMCPLLSVFIGPILFSGPF